MKKPYLLLSLVLSIFHLHTSGQSCDLDLTHQSDISSTCGNITMTMLEDQLDRGYLYVANKSLGLTVYDFSNQNNAIALDTIPTSELGDLDVMNLYQEGNYLYLALGNHFTNPQQSGIAIIDVLSPSKPVTLDYSIVQGSNSGAGIVKVENDLAYLGAMKSGLVIYDVANKADIKFKGKYVPDVNYPVADPNTDLYNARGMEVKDSIVYLCYDAGGLRIINCTDSRSPRETGRYSNPALHQPINRPRAYNNLVLDDTFLYVTVDYCGLEVLNIADTSDITLHAWWNPYGCPANNWFSSSSHTNEIYHEKNCDKLFVSTGKSDLVVLDISDPSNPDSCDSYGGVDNKIGTWGVSAHKGNLYLSYICSIIPFSSNWTGVKKLKYKQCNVGIGNMEEDLVQLYPNPAQGVLNIENSSGETIEINIIDSKGQLILRQLVGETTISLEISNVAAGFYTTQIFLKNKMVSRKFVKH